VKDWPEKKILYLIKGLSADLVVDQDSPIVLLGYLSPPLSRDWISVSIWGVEYKIMQLFCC
jgi:hypothetical protein